MAMVLALVLAASGVSLLPGTELTVQPRRTLKAHLVEVDDELFILRQSLSATGADVFGKATVEAAPFVGLAGLPALLIGLLLRDSSTYRGTPIIETGVIVSTVLFGTAIVATLAYALARVISHGFDAAQWTAREKMLTAYRPLVLSALNASAL